MVTSIGTPWSTRRNFTALVVACTFTAPVAAQSTNPAQQPVILTDPTPRMRDPHTEFGDNPAERLKQQQAALIRNARLHQQIVTTTDQLVGLAEELKNDLATHNKNIPISLDAMKAEKIEKLAKNVKSKMKYL
jgi:hypothetical protein